VCSCGSDYLPKIQWKDTAKSCTFGSGNIWSEFVAMVLVNYWQSYDDYCRYNFCSGKHQHIEQKTISIPNPNGYLLHTSLGNSVKNRLFQENSIVYYQQKANIICNYSTKNNKNSAKQFKKRALKINNW